MLCSEELQKIEELHLRLNRPYELMIFNVLHVKVHKNRNWEKAEQVWVFFVKVARKRIFSVQQK